VLAAATALEAVAQAPPPSVQDANRRNSDTLAKFEIPLATEPAFRFEP
jgi:hypothetical protein